MENSVTEYKLKVVDDLKKEIVAFANSRGGTIYIGIADDGAIVGVEDVDDTMLRVSNMVRDAIKPDVTMFVQYDCENREGKQIVKITVQQGTESPYYLAKKGLRPEGVYVRQGSSSVPASESLIRKMIKATDGDAFEEMRSLNQELSFSSAKQEFAKREIPFEDNQMVTLGLMNREHIYTNLGLLLSDQCIHTIKAASFEGETKELFKDRREFVGSLLKQLNEAYVFIDLYNKTKAEFHRLERVDYRDYPEMAIREALLNAIVHREYGFSGSTLINIFNDRIEFVSLGGLVDGLNKNDILLGVSQCRNEKLAAVFYRLKLIEAYGTGIQKILDAYQGSEETPLLQVSDNAFKIILPNRNHHTEQSKELPVPTAKGRKILDMLEKSDGITRRQAEAVLGASQTMTGKILRDMCDDGLLVRKGKGKNVMYCRKSNLENSSLKLNKEPIQGEPKNKI